MTERAGESIRAAGAAVKRRGLIAGAAALVAGMVAKQASQPVAAAYALLGDADNTATLTTKIVGNVTGTATGGSGFGVLYVQNTSSAVSGRAIFARSEQTALVAQSSSTAGTGVNASGNY